jgi:hypothetical protein
MNGFKSPGYPFVICAWDDAKAVFDVQKTEEIHDSPTTLYYTSGWLLKQNDRGLWIAQEWAPDDNSYRNVTSIPRGWVRELVEFNLSKKRKKVVKAAAPEAVEAAAISLSEEKA